MAWVILHLIQTLILIVIAVFGASAQNHPQVDITELERTITAETRPQGSGARLGHHRR